MNNSGECDQLEGVISFIKDISWSKLPPEARRQAKLFTLEKLDAILARSRPHISEIVSSVAEETWPRSPLDIVLFNCRNNLNS
ncbi:hypothetical protein KGY58_01970 [Candidatus Bipolaricaulota bacterium]|nr:hypothetical protein [Candidatus Bipolaricaulota bacterium]